MLVGFKCPIGTETQGREITFEECLTKECKNCFPYPIRKAISDSVEPRDRWLSPSTITGCLRKAKWSLDHDFYLPVVHTYWMMRGQFIHEILERSANTDAVVEEILSREIPGTGFVLRGKMDHYKDGVLTDYKTMLDTGFGKLIKDIRDEHVWQVNIYKWMASSKYDIKDVRIVYVGMNGAVMTGNKITLDKWGKITEYDIPPCPIYMNEKIQDYVYQRVDKLKHFDTPPASPSAWLCKLCPFTEKCH